MFMVGGQSGDFQSWLNNTQGDAECSLKKTKYENACNCGSSANSQEAEQIRASVIDTCEWTDEYTSCSAVCN